MQQHAVPQNITAFEFKLIGFLTLRQFGYLAGAAIFIFILYSAKLPFIVVLIIGVPLAMFAIALAFVRLNSMPFERWIAAFFNTIYSPNTRVWHREAKSIGFLEPQFAGYLHRQSVNNEVHVVSDPTKLKRYLQTHKKTKAKNLVDIDEDKRLEGLNLASFDQETTVFNSPKFIPKAGELATAGVGLQRMDEVIADTKERSADKEIQ